MGWQNEAGKPQQGDEHKLKAVQVQTFEDVARLAVIAAVLGFGIYLTWPIWFGLYRLIVFALSVLFGFLWMVGSA